MNKIRRGEVKIYKGKEYIAIPEIEEESCTGCCFYDKGICSIDHANDPNCRIFLLGAAEGVADKAMENINRKVGRQIVVGTHSPSFGFEKDERECMELVDIVNASDATVLLVGVGAPKQEKWIAKYRSQMFNIKLFMALGATIDFEAVQA